MFKKKGTFKPRMKRFILRKLVLLAAVFGAAAFAVLSYGMDLWETDRFSALVYMTVFSISALMAPAFAPQLAISRGVALAGTLLAVLSFTAIDTFGPPGRSRCAA